MVWLSHTATAAPLCVHFLLGLYLLPHGQIMALAFIKTKCLQSIAMSAFVELMIKAAWNNINQPEQLFPSLADLKAAALSFLLTLQPTFL